MSSEPKPPLSEASDSDINRLVEDVLSSGKHLTMPDAHEAAVPERYHARAIAGTMQKLAEQLAAGTGPKAPVATDEHDEWWFEVHGKRLGPISLHKIRLLWEDGELTPDSLCWHEGFPKWVSLFKVSELAVALTPKLDVKVDMNTSGEWASPASAGMEAANRKKLELAQQQAGVLPLSTPVNMSDERAATYTTLSPRSRPSYDDEEAAQARPSPMRQAMVSGLMAGVIAAVTVVVLRVAWPVTVPPAIIINTGAMAPALPAEGAAAEPPKPVVAELPKPAAPAPAPAPAAAPAAAPKPAAAAAAPAPVAAAPEEPKKPATVEEAFAKAFAEAPPDELTIGEVMEVVRSHKPQIDACAEAQHAAVPDSTGRIVMKWSVDPDGKVSDVVAPEGEFGACLAKELAGWTFPKHALQHPPVEVPFKY